MHQVAVAILLSQKLVKIYMNPFTNPNKLYITQFNSSIIQFMPRLCSTRLSVSFCRFCRLSNFLVFIRAKIGKNKTLLRSLIKMLDFELQTLMTGDRSLQKFGFKKSKFGSKKQLHKRFLYFSSRYYTEFSRSRVPEEEIR